MNTLSFSCPVRRAPLTTVQLGHGSGGSLSNELVDRFKEAFGDALQSTHDAAVVHMPATGRLTVTTDSFVVTPLFFPGGNIGSLAVHGTVNDLAVMGARPLYATVAFILEAGMPFAQLDQIVASLAEAARISGMQIVSGDTKVVPKGKGDGMYITMTGFGNTTQRYSPEQLCEGDAILLSGDVGRHAMTIMVARGEIKAKTTLETDSAPLWPVISALMSGGVRIRMMRDLTRGGLASGLCEVARASQRDLIVVGNTIPVCEQVKVLLDLVGFDPLQCANEGRFVAFIHPDDADLALDICRTCQESDVARGAVIIGSVGAKGSVVIKRSPFGTESYITELEGDQLPRIC